jgi:glycosyltransferase involved in cell wall biosynthesis
MRIGIDFHLAEREGTGNCSYLRQLVEALLDLGQDHEYLLYVTNPACPYYQTLPLQANIRLRPLAARNTFQRISTLGLKSLTDKVDVLHVQYVAPPVHGGKLVVTIHDISFVHCPDYFSLPLRVFLKTLVPLSIRKAAQIITVSEFSRADIQHHYPAAANKVQITHDAPASKYKPVHDPLLKQILFRTLGLQEKYILYVGRLDRRKNIGGLIRAFSLLKKTQGIPHQLVIAGQKDYLPRPLQEEISEGDIGEQILFTGFVPEELLPALYSLAEVFVYPSLYEGFGLPALEAMACGCPVIASNVTALPEVIGTAGLLIDPAQTASLVEAIIKVISDKALREKMSRDGLARAWTFSWTETAKKTLAVYEAAAYPPGRNGATRKVTGPP